MRQQGAKQNSQQSIKTKKPVSASSQVVTPPPLSNQRNAVQNRSLSPAPSKIPPRNTRSRNSNTISDNHTHLPILQPKKGLQQQQQFQQTQPQQSQQMHPQHFSQSLPHRIPIAEKIIQEEYPFEQINNLVHEYLLKNNMVKTLDTFQDELTQPLPPYDQSRGYEFQLMEHFKRGQREQFFLKWNRFLPLSMLVGDEKVTRLEFYLQIFFFIFPIHPFFKRSSQVDAESIAVFKEYLDTRGAVLSKTSEFLHFYALPYIPKPQEHPALKHLFTNEWIENVRQQLNEFLASVYDNQPLPQLFYVYQSYLYSDKDNGNTLENESNNNSKDIQQSRGSQADKSNNSIAVLQNENRELVNVVKQFNERYMILLNQNRIYQDQNKQMIVESHQKWIVTANELVQISKNLKSMIDGNLHQGIAFQEETLAAIQNRIEKFEIFLNTNVEELISQTQDLSHLDKQSFTNDPEHQLSSDYLISPQPLNFVSTNNFQFNNNDHNANPMQYVNPYCALDYNKIKATIIQQDDIVLCCTLLQALRWRVSKARGAYVRREIIISYANFDVIGCQNPENIPLQTGLFKKNLKIQEFALRLINAMASDFYGRTYLIQSPTLATLLIDIIRKEKSDSFTRRHALGALQKLSLRRKPQKVMINQDLIHWIVQTLRDEKDTLSEYSYEYATALFMNLSLRSSGKLKCEDPKEGVLNVLNELLEHENMQVRTFVNGTLYSLLGRQSLREQANAMGMNEILSYLKETSDERFTKQIQYIMDQLNKQGNQDEGNESDSNEEDNDVDDIDDEEEVGEEEQADDVIDVDQENNQSSQQKQSNGENLLEGQFCLIGQEGVKQLSQCRKIMMESHQNRMLSSANTQGGGGQYSSYHRGMNMDVPFNRPATPSMSASYISHSQKTSYNVARTQQPSQQQQRTQNNSNNSQPGTSNNSLSRPKSNATQNGEIKEISPIITINQLNEEEIRNLPSEMQSRPKILRTPAGGERQRIEELQKQHEYLLQQSYVEQAITYPVPKKEKPKPKDKEKEKPSGTGSQQLSSSQQKISEAEQPKSAPSVVLPVDSAIKPPEGQVAVVEQAFDSKPKIPRTPPGLQK